MSSAVKSVAGTPTSPKGREENQYVVPYIKIIIMMFLFLSKQFNIGQGPNHLGRCLSNNHSIKSRRRSLDPDLWKQRPFVIVDPSDPEEILYLREGEFHQCQRVSLSNGINLTIIARDTTPVSEIGPVQKQSSQEEQTAQTSTSSSHIKKSPPKSDRSHVVL